MSVFPFLIVRLMQQDWLIAILVLINMASLIGKHIRKTDSLYRLGGEEFVVLAMGTGLQAVKQLAKNLRTSVASEALIKNKRSRYRLA